MYNKGLYNYNKNYSVSGSNHHNSSISIININNNYNFDGKPHTNTHDESIQEKFSRLVVRLVSTFGSAQVPLSFCKPSDGGKNGWICRLCKENGERTAGTKMITTVRYQSMYAHLLSLKHCKYLAPEARATFERMRLQAPPSRLKRKMAKAIANRIQNHHTPNNSDDDTNTNTNTNTNNHRNNSDTNTDQNHNFEERKFKNEVQELHSNHRHSDSSSSHTNHSVTHVKQEMTAEEDIVMDAAQNHKNRNVNIHQFEHQPIQHQHQQYSTVEETRNAQPLQSNVLQALQPMFIPQTCGIDINQAHLWTEYDVIEWIRHLVPHSMEWTDYYARAFIENGIDGRILLETDLKLIMQQCKIHHLHRMQFILAVNQLRNVRQRCLQRSLSAVRVRTKSATIK